MMIVVKYMASRLQEAFSDDADFESLGSTIMTRLGHQANMSAELGYLIENPLNTPSDRLNAESQAVDLLAQWMAPNYPPVKPLSLAHNVPAEECKKLQSVADKLVSNLLTPPSLHELAAQAQMSHAKLNRCFKKVYGATVYSWLRNYRLERAKQCLNTSVTITDVAFQCGFSSASHFAQAFKQRYGCSPMEHKEGLK